MQDIQVLRSEERKRFDHGWLDTRHTFSFAGWFDPARMGFSDLRVINEDVVDPGAGFPPHGHRDMEILSWVLDGGIAHRDSTGTGAVLRPGEAQLMSAGTGVMHSEYNASDDEALRFLQIWILPDRRGGPARYQQEKIDLSPGALATVAAPAGEDAAMEIRQDARVFAGRADEGRPLRYAARAGRATWVQVTRGALRVDDELLSAGDAAYFTGARELELRADAPAEVLIFDLREEQ